MFLRSSSTRKRLRRICFGAELFSFLTVRYAETHRGDIYDSTMGGGGGGEGKVVKDEGGGKVIVPSKS